MERKIGDEFTTMVKGKLTKLIVIAEVTCEGCAFETMSCVNKEEVLKETGRCASIARKDMASVVFKECKIQHNQDKHKYRLDWKQFKLDANEA